MFKVVWEQEDYDGNIVTLEREFSTKDEAIEFVEQKRWDAVELGKHFRLLSVIDSEQDRQQRRGD